MTKDEILASLPKLEKADLLAVQAVIAKLVGGVSAIPLGDPSVALFAVLAGLLGQSMTYAAFARTSNHKHWLKNAPGVVDFIKTTFPNVRTRVEEQAMMRLVLGLVIEDLTQRLRAKPSIGMISTNLPRIPELFDNAFPSYRESGLAHLIPQVMGIE